MNGPDRGADDRYDARPDGVDPRGVPGDRSGREGLILAAALLAAVLGLVVTLGWVVFHRITGA